MSYFVLNKFKWLINDNLFCKKCGAHLVTFKMNCYDYQIPSLEYFKDGHGQQPINANATCKCCNESFYDRLRRGRRFEKNVDGINFK